MGNEVSGNRLDDFQKLFGEYCALKCPLPPKSFTAESTGSDGNPPHQLFVGDVQGGKSNVMALKALYLAIVCKQDVVILCRNCVDDPHQLKQSTFDDHRKNFTQFAQERGVLSQLAGQYRWPRIVLAQDKAEMQTFKTQDADHGPVENPSTGTIFLPISNTHHFDRLLDIFTPGQRQMHMIVDEADKLAYGDDGPVARKMETLLDIASSVSFVTATAHNVMIDDRFKCCDIYHLPRHPNYKGFENLNWIPICKKPKNVRRDKDGTMATPLERDPDLWHIVLERESARNVFENGQPRIGLIKTERVIASQCKLADDIHDKMPEKFITIVYNSNHIVVNCPSLTLDTVRAFKACDIKCKADNRHNVVVSRVSIRKILHAIRTQLFLNWNAMRPILIISDLVAQRGVHLRDLEYEWHLSFEVLRTCKSTTVPTIIQELRILGIYRDNVPLTLYCDDELHRHLRVESMAHRELIERSAQLGRQRQDMSIRAAIASMSLDVRKTTERKQMRHGPARLPVRVTAPRSDKTSADGGFGIEDYGIIVTPPALLQSATRSLPPGADKDDDNTDDVPPMDPKELERLTDPKKGMFKKWARVDNTTAIARFMREGLEPQRRYSRQELSVRCTEYGVQLSDITGLRQSGEHRHSLAQIVCHVGKDKLMLHPELREAFYYVFQ